MFETTITDDYNSETGIHNILLPLQNGESIRFEMTEHDILALLKTFASILYKSKLAEIEHQKLWDSRTE
jgi:hypothetical protein